MIKPSLALGLILTAVSIIMSPLAIASAETSLGYQAATPIPVGQLASLESINSNRVVPATDANANLVVGVVVAAKDSLITWSDSQANTQIAIGGVVDTAVTDRGGTIKQGDRIMASPYAGIGMKARIGARVVGIAQADFKGGNGQIPIQVQVATWTSGNADAASLVPPYIQTLADAIAAKHTSPVRIILAVFVLLTTFLLAVIIMITAVRGAMAAIGRNPLAASNVHKGFWRVMLITISLLAAGLVAATLILKL